MCNSQTVIACPKLHATLHMQSLMCSNLPCIALHMQLLPSCSSQPCMILHVRIHSSLAHVTLHPELPYLVWLGRQRTLFCSCPCILVQAQLALFLPYWSLEHCTILFHRNQCMSYRNRVLCWKFRLVSWWSNLQIDRYCRAASMYWCISIWWLQMEWLCKVARHIHMWYWIIYPLLWL